MASAQNYGSSDVRTTSLCTAARWLQSVQPKLSTTTWEEFCNWIVVRFGRNQHQALLRQLYHIHQLDSVANYVDKFSELIDQLAAYEPNINNLHYTTRFIDGLTPAIRSIIAIQCPGDLDTAYSLALLQEEVTTGALQFHQRAAPTVLALPSLAQHPLPLPAPPKPLLLDNKTTVASLSTRPEQVRRADDKWAALRNYRRARGLCFQCGEKWSRDHQCKGTV